ncbi:hypothetical protein Tco_1075155, partial [Tanacetum coccineum]
EGNVGQCSTSISCTAALNEGNVPINVIDSPATPSNSGPMLSGPTSYAKLVTSEPIRKSVNFFTLVAPEGNMADVTISVESVRAISERFANSKFGLVKSMLSSSNRLFFFKFNSNDRMDAMLENGPCEDSLRVIATKLDIPLMLDSYTSDMCMQSWDRSIYARAMIEL